MCDLNSIRPIIQSTVRFNSKESFDIVFSLSGVFETGQFVARQEELDEMHKSLVHSVGRQAVTLHGLGGIGKTQLAIAYAKAHRDAYSAVFWLNIQDEASVKRSYYKIARRIQRKHPTTSQLGGITEDTQLDEAVSAVKRWLERAQNTRWLMVFDNYDNPKYPGNKDTKAIDIQQYLPEAYHGSVIVTTKSSRVNEGRRIKIGKMNVHNSLQILSNSSHREGVMDGTVKLDVVKATLTFYRS